MRRAYPFLLVAVALGCTEHRIEVAPIKVKPIKATVNVNIKVDRKLERFFAFEDKIRKQEGNAASGEADPSKSDSAASEEGDDS